jgi:hypothetical protein
MELTSPKISTRYQATTLNRKDNNFLKNEIKDKPINIPTLKLNSNVEDLDPNDSAMLL